jgi:hypothetical protein
MINIEQAKFISYKKASVSFEHNSLVQVAVEEL